MENLYVTFEVEVSDIQYSYGGKRGMAEVQIRVPRTTLESLDLHDMFVSMMETALAEFDALEAEPETEGVADHEA